MLVYRGRMARPAASSAWTASLWPAPTMTAPGLLRAGPAAVPGHPGPIPRHHGGSARASRGRLGHRPGVDLGRPTGLILRGFVMQIASYAVVTVIARGRSSASAVMILMLRNSVPEFLSSCVTLVLSSCVTLVLSRPFLELPLAALRT
jgi:hypothetical protein